MKSTSLASGFCALLLCACGTADETGFMTDAQGTAYEAPHSEGPAEFKTDDTTYALGEQLDADGALVNIEVVYDAGASYLTPQSPNASWIVDRAAAHTQQRSLLLNDVAVRGLYVRDCATGDWVNTACTEFAAESELLQGVFDGDYLLGHFYGNILTNALLNSQFECETEPASFATVTVDGEAQQVQRVGEVEFAYVVEHRE
jgi:hypothetical protein